MKRKINIKIFTAVLIIPFLILSDILLCTVLYFFEPVSYSAPELYDGYFSFDLYNKYSYEKNSEFYIKQISAEDITVHPDDIRLKYVNNTINIFASDDSNYNDIASLAQTFSAEICGYIKSVDYYQLETDNSDYEQIVNICSELTSSELVLTALPDYFEETPLESEFTEVNEDSFDAAYLEVINYPDDISQYLPENIVTAGVFDILADRNCEYLNIVNKDTYDDSWIADSTVDGFAFHGTHVAGILGASADSMAPAVCPDTPIVSDCGINTSLSYWIASLTDMIVNYEAKVINMSLGYNPYIIISASMGCEQTLSFIADETEFFQEFVLKLTDDYEFLFFIAAGNSSGYSANRISNGYFSYGDKKLLDKLDIFNIFTAEPKLCDSAYSFVFNNFDNEEAADRVIIVGSCDEFKKYASYSNSGDRVDVVTIGEMIYSTSLNNGYAYSGGTSMAAPFVAGTAALIFSINPDITAEEVKNAITSSATEYVSDGSFEYPLLNVENALKMVSE